jgi:DoxX-like family
MRITQSRSAGRAWIVAYWVITGLVCAELLTGGVWDLVRTHHVVEVLTQLGYPVYMLAIIGAWKLLAVPALLAPGFARLKEWAYAGIFFEMTGAAVSHGVCGEGAAMFGPLALAGLAVVSWALRPPSRTCGTLGSAE